MNELPERARPTIGRGVDGKIGVANSGAVSDHSMMTGPFAAQYGRALIALAEKVGRAELRAIRRAEEADLKPGSPEWDRFADRVLSHELEIRPIIEVGDVVMANTDLGWVRATVVGRNGLAGIWSVRPHLDSPQDEIIPVEEDDIRFEEVTS